MSPVAPTASPRIAPPIVSTGVAGSGSAPLARVGPASLSFRAVLARDVAHGSRPEASALPGFALGASLPVASSWLASPQRAPVLPGSAQHIPPAAGEVRREADAAPGTDDAADDSPSPVPHRPTASFAGAPHSPLDLAAVPALDLAQPAREATESRPAAPSLEDLVPSLVRRIAWSGDRHRGSMRLEIGAGELSGATLLVHADEGRVRVHLDVPPGVDPRPWQARIARRLASRGVATDAVEVT